MNKWLELILGIILVIVPVLCAINFLNWGIATIHFLMGLVIVGVVVIGIVLIILGISDIRG